jgi:pimeloyl-ACP methyl ester carboxylesterase
VSDLHVDAFGEGAPALFVHGTFSWGLDTFSEQRALADEYRVLLVDRRGFGQRVSSDSDGWPTDMHDLSELLDEVGPAHLVGQSYGAVVALLAAGLCPHRVLSLVAIEPSGFELARGDTDADAAAAALKPAYARAAELTTEEFVTEWARGRGMTAERLAGWTETWGERDWAAAEASRRERWPGDAPVRLDVLAKMAVPKVLVRGAWKPEVVGREGAGRDFAAVCRAVAEGIGARTVVFEHSSHNPQSEEPEAFNRLLRDIWSSAVRIASN